MWFQKHTQFPGPGRTEKNVVGVRVLPVFAVKSGAFFAVTVGILALMGGLFQINPIWNLGPYKPSQISAGSQPDFYMMWTDGLARLWPAWEFYPFGHTIPRACRVAVFMGLVFVLLIAYPFLEKQFTGDNAHHNLLQRPRDVPVRTAIGAMAIAFYIVLTFACINDIIALQVRHLAERDDVDRPDRPGRSCRRSPTSSPTGGPRPAAQRPRRCSSTASRPASSSGCRTVSTSRCTSRSARSTTTATRSRWSTRVPRCPRR